MTAHNLDREVVEAFTRFQQGPKPAQCSGSRHVYDTDGKRVVGDKCRCGKKPIKRMQ